MRGILTAPLCLTHTSGLLPTPVRRGRIATGEHFEALQLVAGETAKVGFSAWVQVRHGNLSSGRLFGESTAQHKRWGGKKVRNEKSLIINAVLAGLLMYM